HLVDTEVLRDLRESDAVFTGPSHAHDIVAELLGVGSGHGAHPSRPPYGQARSDVTYRCGSPDRVVVPAKHNPSRFCSGLATVARHRSLLCRVAIGNI